MQNKIGKIYWGNNGQFWCHIEFKCVNNRIIFKCRYFLQLVPHPFRHPHPDEGHVRKKEQGLWRGGWEVREKRYLCVGHLGRALSPKAQQDGENRERVSETEKVSRKQTDRERKKRDRPHINTTSGQVSKVFSAVVHLRCQSYRG